MTDADIDIWYGTPGVGKTRKWFKDMEKCTGKKWYITTSHVRLDEQEEKNEDWLHLHGLQKICPCLQEGKFYNQKIANLVGTYPEIPNKYICNLCKVLDAFDQKECPYHSQAKKLEHADKVMSPPQYLATSWFHDFGAEYVTIDDCMMQKRKHPSLKKLEEVYKLYWMMLRHGEKPRLSFKEFLDDPDFDEFIRLAKDNYELNLKTLVSYAEKFEDIGRIPFWIIPPEELDIYRKYYRKHGHPTTVRVVTPFLFDLFDYITQSKKKVKVTIIDAYPNRMFLNKLKFRYEMENHRTFSYNWVKIETKFKNLGSVVHQILPQKGAWLPIDTSINNNRDMREWIGCDIQDILRQYFNGGKGYRIGFVTSRLQWMRYKDHLEGRAPEHEFIKDEFGVQLGDILYYWNQRGSNNLEHCNPIFIVGTPVVNRKEFVKEFEEWFAHRPSTTETVEKEPHGDTYHYVDSELENLRSMLEDDELVQAILRGRPHLYKKSIFAYAKVTDSRIRDDPILNFQESYNRKRGGNVDEKEEWLIEYVKEHKCHVPENVAREAMHDRFNIGLGWAYEKIRKIVRKNDSLHLDCSSSVKWLVRIESESE